MVELLARGRAGRGRQHPQLWIGRRFVKLPVVERPYRFGPRGYGNNVLRKSHKLTRIRSIRLRDRPVLGGLQCRLLGAAYRRPLAGRLLVAGLQRFAVVCWRLAEASKALVAPICRTRGRSPAALGPLEKLVDHRLAAGPSRGNRRKEHAGRGLEKPCRGRGCLEVREPGLNRAHVAFPFQRPADADDRRQLAAR